MNASTFSEVYIQTGRVKQDKIGIIVTQSLLGGYIAHVYELIENPADKENPARASLIEKVEFNKWANGRNYQDVQKFVKKKTGAEAVSYDPDDMFSAYIGSDALRQALRNHMDLS